MKLVAGRAQYFGVVIAGFGILLAALLLWEWERGQALERELLSLQKMPVTAVPPQQILPEFVLSDLQTAFPELLARPVFATNRRAYASAGQPEAETMKKGQFVLVGVLLSPGNQSALLRDAKTGKTETVARSGTVRGMLMGDVQANRVLLRQGNETEELLLNVLTGPKVAAPQRTLATPADAASLPPPRPLVSASTAAGAATSAALPASASALAAASAAASAPRPPTAQELIQREKQQQAALEAARKQGPSVPASAPPAAALK